MTYPERVIFTVDDGEARLRDATEELVGACNSADPSKVAKAQREWDEALKELRSDDYVVGLRDGRQVVGALRAQGKAE